MEEANLSYAGNEEVISRQENLMTRHSAGNREQKNQPSDISIDLTWSNCQTNYNTEKVVLN